MTSKIPAPRFRTQAKKKGDYPLGGVVTGPAWRKIWDLLQDAGESYVAGADLAQAAADASGGARSTARGLLIRAAGDGLLERYEGSIESRRGARKHTYYRIAR